MTPYDNLRDIAPTVVWDGLIARALHGAEASLTAIEIEPGTAVPEHSHENEQIGILTGGSLTFRIGGEERELRPGGTWLIPAERPAFRGRRAGGRPPDRGLRAAPNRLGRPRAPPAKRAGRVLARYA